MSISQQLRSWIYPIWIFIFNLYLTEQSHFQGASVSWRPGRIYQDENITEVLADFRIVWKRNSNQLNSTYCDDDHIASGGLLGDNDNSYGWQCNSGCDVTDAKFDAACTQYDVVDDWSLGTGVANFNITGNGDFEIELSGCCWISSLVYISNDNENWSVIISGNVGTRSDTGLPNRSPVTSTTPVIRFQAGCPNSVDLPLYDEDKDTIVCRTAECPQSSCTAHPYLKLTQHGDKCRLSYNAGGPGDISVAVSIILEDFPRKEDLLVGGTLQNTTEKLSSVEIQFLIHVYTDTGACSQKPMWGSETFSNGLIKMATSGQETIIDLTVQSTNGIALVNPVGPEGISKGPLTGPDSNNQYSTYLAFTPTSEQAGEHVICVTAKDDFKKMSEQRCMVLIVGDKSPCEIDNGGCDGKCVTAGQSYYCDCDRECWQLAEDKRTCIPAIDIQCLPDRFALELPNCAVTDATAISIGYVQANSEAPCKADSNGTYYTSEFTYQDCATQTESDFTEIHYMNKVRMWVDESVNTAGSGDGAAIITRGYYYNMELICSFSKYANVNATFKPQDREENSVQVPGLGSFQFFFDFYYDEQFGAAYSPYEYPITVTVNSDIYFAIRTVGSAGLEVFTEKCVAMTTPTPTASTVSYTMIENGCLEDDTMQAYATANKMEDRYSVKAFRFQDNLNTDSSVNIYIQCSAVLCVVGEETRCQKGCIRTRKRRDGQNEILVDRQKRSAEDEEGEPEASNNNVSESNIIEITVSGPFRIEVQRLSNEQLVTVVTPTTDPPVNVEPKPVADGDSGLTLIIASSVGGFLFFILLVTIVIMLGYYHCILKPRHKILPEKENIVKRVLPVPEAWADDCEGMKSDRTVTREYPLTPPPSFWDAQTIR